MVVGLRATQFNAVHKTGRLYDRWEKSHRSPPKSKEDRWTVPGTKKQIGSGWWRVGLFEQHIHKNEESANNCEHVKNRREEEREKALVTWRSDLSGLGTGWSFKENWTSSAVLASSLLTALLAGSDLLTQLLGTRSKEALALAAVSGALGALLIGVGPLILKAVGHRVEKPTVGGMLTASGLATVGVLGQVFVLARLGVDLFGTLLDVITITGALLLSSLTIVYAARAMEFNIAVGFTPPPPQKGEDAAEAAAPADSRDGRLRQQRQSALI
jgi:hypothetical protein